MIRRISNLGKNSSKFFFEFNIHSLHNLDCDLDDFVAGTRLFVCVSRRKKRYWTGPCTKFDNGEGDWRQATLTFPVTLYCKKKALVFDQKDFLITVYTAVTHSEDQKQKSQLQSKTAMCQCKIDIAKFARLQGAEDTLEVPLKALPGQKCANEETRLLLTVKSRWVKDGSKISISETNSSNATSVSTMFPEAKPNANDEGENLGEGMRLCDFAREFKRKSFVVYAKVQEILTDVRSFQDNIDGHFTNITARLENAQQSLSTCSKDRIQAIGNVTRAIEACRQNVKRRLLARGQDNDVLKSPDKNALRIEMDASEGLPADLESDALSQEHVVLAETFEHTYKMLQSLLKTHDIRVRELAEARREFAKEEELSRQTSQQLEGAETELQTVETQVVESKDELARIDVELEAAKTSNKELAFRLKALQSSTSKLQDNLTREDLNEDARRRVNAIQRMRLGSDCYKYSSKGKQQKRYIELSFDEENLTWSASRHRSRFSGPSQVALKDVTELVYGPGQMPAAVQQTVLAWRCFSIITKERLYDFCMSSDEDIQAWFLGLQYLLEDSVQDVRIMSRFDFLKNMSVFKLQNKQIG